MPRDSNGNYALPAGNPVSTQTPIAISWANGTMSDIGDVLTASLDRSGNGGMLAALKLFDGTVAAPGAAFGSETASGLYRIGAARLGMAISGAKVAEFKAAGVDVVGTLTSSGAATLASAVITAGLTVGTTLGVTGAATFSSTTSHAGVASFLPGTAALPGITFTGDPNTGVSAQTADTLILSTAGTARGTFSAASILLAATALTLTGAVGVTGALTVSTTLGVTGIATFADDIRVGDGSAASPSVTFGGDTNTGLYSPDPDELGFSLGGTGYLVGFRNVPINTQNGSYTLVLTDSGRAIHKASGGAGETLTIPANASVAYPTGTVLTFVNTGGGALTIAITSDTMTMAGTGSTGSRTLADDGIATAIKLTSTTWLISGTGLS